MRYGFTLNARTVLVNCILTCPTGYGVLCSMGSEVHQFTSVEMAAGYRFIIDSYLEAPCVLNCCIFIHALHALQIFLSVPFVCV